MMFMKGGGADGEEDGCTTWQGLGGLGIKKAIQAESQIRARALRACRRALPFKFVDCYYLPGPPPLSQTPAVTV